MKVLTLVGVKPKEEDWRHTNRPLARVYFSRWTWPPGGSRLVVKPVSKELETFAQEVKRLINDRLVNHPTQAFVYPDPDSDHPHGRKIVDVEDPNLIEAIRSDLFLWGRSGPKDIAGYYVLSTFSHIEDRRSLFG